MSTTAQATTEIEMKFAATAKTPTPELGGVLPHVASESTAVHHLSAVYFDTEDLRLTRAKITLRRRTGGKDAGWHLKMPKQGARRVELQADLGHDTPPAELLAPVRSLVRDLPLVPIAQVDNERHETLFRDAEGAAVAEFCDDHVTAWSLLSGGDRTTWREWEVEIGAAYAAEAEAMLEVAERAAVDKGAEVAESPSKLATALGDSIHNAPEPPTPAGLPKKSPARAVAQAVAGNRDRLVELDPLVRSDAADSVHQMRVATRELRSHLQTFSGIIRTQPELLAELKHLAGVLGVARDAEVITKRFTQLPIDAQNIARLTEASSASYRSAHAEAVALLDSARYFRLLGQLDEVVSRPEVLTRKPKDARKTLVRHLDEAFSHLVDCHRKAVVEWEDPAVSRHHKEENFHDVRKAAKRLRYCAETVPGAEKVYAACKRLQTTLGDFQDCVTSRDALRAIATQAHRQGVDTFEFGIAYQVEHRASRQALAGYSDEMKKVRAAFKKWRKKN